MHSGAGRGGMAERRRTGALATLTLAALLLHAGLLGGLEGLVADETAAKTVPSALTVRMLMPPEPMVPVAPTALAAPAPLVAAALPVPPPAPDSVPVPALTPEPKRPVVVAMSAARPAAVLMSPSTAAPPVALQASQPDPVPASAMPEPDPAAASSRAAALADMSAEAPPPPAVQAPPAAEARASVDAQSALARLPESLAAPSPPSAADRELPVYRTLIPPPIQLRYQLRRGALQGTGDFQWLPEGGRYEARLEGRVAGITVLTQHSQGGFDEAGVAPLRFTDRRGIGALQAANFQREVGKISFSGPSVEYPLLIGSQDRLSWMVQLAAVVAAEPQRLQDGGKVVIHVVGARGDSRLWVFRFAAHEGVRTGGGIIQAARFVREGVDPYDTRVEVWLDPQRHHLPARAVLRSGPDDDGLELIVQEPVAVP